MVCAGAAELVVRLPEGRLARVVHLVTDPSMLDTQVTAQTLAISHYERQENKNTRKKYRRMMRAGERVGEQLLNGPARLITRADAQRLHDTIAERAPTTAGDWVSFMRAAWARANRAGHVYGDNPWTGIEKTRQQPADLVFPQGWLVGLLDKIEAAPPSVLSAQWKNSFTFEACTGARPGCEVAKMRWEDLDDRAGRLVFPHSKCGARSIPFELILGRAREALEAQRGLHADLVWPGKGGAKAKAPVSEAARCAAWKQFREWAHADGFNMKTGDGRWLTLYQGTRHALATHLAQLGLPMQKIALLLGHKTTKTTQRYVHLGVDDVRDAGRQASASLQKGEAVDTDTDGQCLERVREAVRMLQPHELKRLTKSNGTPLSSTTIGELRAGRRTLSHRNTKRTAQMLGMSVGWLYGEAVAGPRPRALNVVDGGKG